MNPEQQNRANQGCSKEATGSQSNPDDFSSNALETRAQPALNISEQPLQLKVSGCPELVIHPLNDSERLRHLSFSERCGCVEVMGITRASVESNIIKELSLSIPDRAQFIAFNSACNPYEALQELKRLARVIALNYLPYQMPWSGSKASGETGKETSKAASEKAFRNRIRELGAVIIDSRTEDAFKADAPILDCARAVLHAHSAGSALASAITKTPGWFESFRCESIRTHDHPASLSAFGNTRYTYMQHSDYRVPHIDEAIQFALPFPGQNGAEGGYRIPDYVYPSPNDLLAMDGDHRYRINIGALPGTKHTTISLIKIINPLGYCYVARAPNSDSVSLVGRLGLASFRAEFKLQTLLSRFENSL